MIKQRETCKHILLEISMGLTYYHCYELFGFVCDKLGTMKVKEVRDLPTN